MSRIRLILAVVAIVVSPASVVAQLVDLYGDPLPRGAVARLGTNRFRSLYSHEVPSQILADGKIVLSSTRFDIRWVERATGRVTDTWPLPEGHRVTGFSPDGRLAVLNDEKTLQLWDVARRKELRIFQLTEARGTDALAQFSPDNRIVAFGIGVHARRQLLVCDVASGRELWGEQGIAPLGFLLDGATLLVLHRSDDNVSLRESATGRAVRSFSTIAQRDCRMARLSPDGKTVLMGTTGAAVRAWDVATGKEVPHLGGHRAEARVCAISRDSKIVLTGGQDPFVQVWDWPDSKMRRRIELPARRDVFSMAVSPDGKQAEIVLEGELAPRFVNLETGNEVATPNEGHRGPVKGVAIAPDGQVVSAGTDNTIRVWDLRTGRLLHTHATQHPLGASTMALSADGHLVATADWQRGTVALHERETGQLARTLDARGLCLNGVAFSPVGSHLAGFIEQPYGLVVWDAATGQEVRRWKDTLAMKPVFSHDGRLVAAIDTAQVRLREVATGRERQAPPFLCKVAFSPDDRTLACANIGHITLWELAAAQERCRLMAKPWGQLETLQFSPDGRWLAWGDLRAVHLCDVRLGREVHTFYGHDNWIKGLAFTADSRALASCSDDSTILIWDLTGLMQHSQLPTKHLPDLNACWGNLADTDAAKAYQAIWSLVAAPKESVPFLADRLKPAAAVDEKRIAELIAGLDSDKFAEREKAGAELEKLGEAAGPALDKLLKGNPSQEARRRAEAIVAKLSGPVTAPEQLRTLRAIEALEHIGSPEATQVIEKLAKGAAGARETEDAKRSLERLKKRQKN